MQGAVDFHETNAVDFTDKYKNNPDFKERFDLWSMKIEEYLQDKNNVLDIGCGPGLMSNEVAKYNKKVLAFDGSQSMIDICRKNNKSANISFEIGMIPDYLQSQQANKYDAIISSSVLEYIQDIDTTLAAIKDISTQNVVILLSLPNGSSWYRKFERFLYNTIGKPGYLSHVYNVLKVSDFSQIAANHGFKIVEHTYFASKYKMSNLLKLFLPMNKRANLILYILVKKDK